MDFGKGKDVSLLSKVVKQLFGKASKNKKININ